MAKRKPSARETSYTVLVFAVAILLWIVKGWKVAGIYLVSVIIAVNILKLIRGKSLFEEKK